MATVPKFFNSPQEKKEFYPSKIWKILLLFIVIFLVLIILFFFSPLFKIKNIEISSTNGEINSFFSNFKGKNLFLVDTSKTKSDIKNKYPEILDVQISKGIPNVLRVKVTERQLKMIWVSGGKKYYVDENGLVFIEGDTQISNLPSVIDNKNLPVEILKPVVISSFVNFITEIPGKLTGSDLIVDHYEVNETTFQVDAVTKNNLKIIFDTTRPLDAQIAAAQKVYTEHKTEITKYLDVRVEGKVYYQ